MDLELQEILHDIKLNAHCGCSGCNKDSSDTEVKLLLYIQNHCIQAYNLGVARERWFGVPHSERPPIPQWLQDMGVTQ